MTAPVDWSRWRKCDACGAGIGEPCLTRSGYDNRPGGGVVAVAAPLPHGCREPRTGTGPGRVAPAGERGAGERDPGRATP